MCVSFDGCIKPVPKVIDTNIAFMTVTVCHVFSVTLCLCGECSVYETTLFNGGSSHTISA